MMSIDRDDCNLSNLTKQSDYKLMLYLIRHRVHIKIPRFDQIMKILDLNK